jgi:NTP pyrophosphatase (non-canonical NTP hydrolase)
MSDLKELTDLIIKYRDARDWKQFHNPKDIAISLSLETSEVLEHFQWKNEKEMEEHIKNHKKELGEELADVLYYVLLLAYESKIDLKKAFINKMEINKKKYPVKKSKGKHTKYNKL